MREFTNRLIEMVEDGSFDPIDALRACLKYMSEDEVEDMCNMNDFTDYMFEPDEEEEDEVEDMFDFEEEDDVEEFDPPLEFNHIGDIWDTLEQCETEEEIEDVLDEIPRKFGTWFCDKIDDGVVEVTNQWWDDNQQDMMVESQRFEVRFMED